MSISMKYKKQIELCILFSVAILFLVLAKDINPDIWFMLNNGKYIVENLSFPTKEFMTVHTSFDVFAEKWLTCVIFWVIYSNFGMIGLEILKILLILVILLLIYYIFNKKSNNPIFLTFMVFSLSFLFLIQKRPNLFSIPILLIEYILLEEYTETKNLKLLIWFPILSIIMMQFHSTYFIWYFIIAFPYLFQNCIWSTKGEELRTELRYSFFLFLSGVISLVVTIINPYGIKSVINVFKQVVAVSDWNNLVSEMVSPQFWSICLFTILLYLIIFIMAICNSNCIKLKDTILFILVFFFSIKTVRNTLYLSVFGIFSIVNIYNFRLHKNIMKNIVACCFIFILIVIIPINIYYSEFYHKVDIILETVPKDSKLFSSRVYDTGPYLSFNGRMPYMDARAEIYSNKINNVYNAYDELQKWSMGDIETKELQDKYNFDYYIAERYTDKVRYDIEDWLTLIREEEISEEQKIWIYMVDK